MAKFASIEKGTLARKRGVVFTDLSGQEWTCDLRVLSGSDDREILACATREAVAQKREPKRGEPIFDFAIDVETLFQSAIDSESPDNAPAPFFKSRDQILDSLDRDRIHVLVAQQTVWQDEHSPLQHDMNDAQFASKIVEIVTSTEGDGGPFERLALRSLYRFTRALAVQFVSLQMRRSSSTSTTSESGSERTLTSPPSSA